jgi:type IV pilus assembly protein PilC
MHSMFKTWDRKSRRLLIERVEMYAAAGLPIGVAIYQAGQGSPKKQGLSLERVRSLVEGGQSVSSTFAQELKYPAAVVGIISCGESSGHLSQALKSGHALLEREEDLIKKCMSAMTYPLVIAIAAGVLTIGLVRGIMPQITPLLTGLHTDLPILTRVVMKLSDLLTLYGIYAGLILVICGAGMLWAIRKVYAIRRVVHICAIRIPILGSLIDRYALAVFFQSMGALTESGMAADLAYEKAIAAISLIPLRRRLEVTRQDVTRGGSFGAIFAKGMPSYIAPLISAGEASGNLTSAFSRVAGMLDRELDHSLKRMTALIEPIMMIGMGCTVGAIALSIMMPIYDISKTLQH